jgi:hypothetical protein
LKVIGIVFLNVNHTKDNLMAGKSPTQLTLAKLQKDSYPLVQVVEKWNSWGRVRVDLFGIIDVLAISEEGDTVAIQTTSLTNVGARIKKISDSEAIKHIRKAGWTVLVHGWYKKNNRWHVKEVDVS